LLAVVAPLSILKPTFPLWLARTAPLTSSPGGASQVKVKTGEFSQYSKTIEPILPAVFGVSLKLCLAVADAWALEIVRLRFGSSAAAAFLKLGIITSKLVKAMAISSQVNRLNILLGVRLAVIRI
jgi:hypothetical protein